MTILDSYSASTPQSAEAVFALWAEPASWPVWDPGVSEASLEGSARLGARGSMRPASGPPVKFNVIGYEANRVFTNASSMPGARLVFEHLVTPTPDGSHVSVTVRLEGPLAGLWSRVLRGNLGDSARSSAVALLAHLDAGRDMDAAA